MQRWSFMTNLLFWKTFTVLDNFCLSCMFQWLEVHSIVDITFLPSLNLTVNSRKRSSLFKRYDITGYDITVIKTGRPAVTEPDGMTIKLDDLCLKLFWWLFCESTQFIVVPQLPHSNLFTPLLISINFITTELRSYTWFSKWIIENLIKMRYLPHHELSFSNFE